jgi:PBSX family phage portal protein
METTEGQGTFKIRQRDDEPSLFQFRTAEDSSFSPYERMGVRRTSDEMIEVEKAVDGTVDKASQQIIEDPFRLDYDAYGVIRPPINLLELSSLWEKNTILGPCIEAMNINCEAFWHIFEPRFKRDDVDDATKHRMDVEYSILENFFNNASVNEPHLSFTDLRLRKRTDQEGVGGAFWEVVRSNDGELMGFNHIPAHTCRWGKLTTEEIETKQKIVVFSQDGKADFRYRTVRRNFRLVLQRRGIRLAWFKTLGDPRVINRHNGYVADEDLPVADRANEVVFFPNVYSGRTPYTFPRFTGALFSIYGSRSADEINYTTFENNMIPSMAIMVSNGMLTKGSIGRYKEFTEANIVGRKNYSVFLLLESEPITEGVANPGTMKLDIKPLTGVQHKDELFQEYDKNNRDKVRGSFRLPPIYLGNVVGYNKSTASTSRKLAEEQVFGPERERFDQFINAVILPELNILYWKFHSNSPDTTDNEDLIKLLVGGEKSGGSNPRIAREVMNRVFSKNLGPIKGIDPEVPYSMQLAEVMQAGGVPENRLSVPGENSVNRAGKLPSLDSATAIDKAEKLRRSRVNMERMYQELFDDWHSSAFQDEQD